MDVLIQKFEIVIKKHILFLLILQPIASMYADFMQEFIYWILWYSFNIISILFEIIFRTKTLAFLLELNYLP